MKLSKRPFRDSNCRYAFRLATAQTGGGSLFACNAGCSPLVRSRSRGRRLPHTSEKVKKECKIKTWLREPKVRPTTLV